MNSKIINIDNYKFYLEYYKNDIDFKDNVVNNFVFIRNFEMYNDIVYDKDLFFIDKNIFENIKDLEYNDKVVFPIKKENNISFSNSQSNFNYYEFTDLKDIYYDIYQDNDIANIKCDKIRIYNSIIKKDLDYIIYIDNYINGIHFHYFCNLNSNFKTRCEKEIKINQDRYIEYIEIKIPNIESLFSSNYYFIENYNKIINSNVQNIVDYYNNENQIDINATNKLYFDNIIKPYYIKDNKKIFIDNKEFEYNNNFINSSINITLYPYKEVVNNIYLQSENNAITSFIHDDYYFRLNSKMGFDNHTISILNCFEFPGKINTDDNYYDVDIHGNYRDDNFKDKYVNQVTNYYNSFYIHDNISNLLDQESYRDELDIEDIRTTGYHIEIANDIDFKEIIFDSIINTDNQNNNFIYDFSFSLDNIVNDWSQLNEILVIRSKFIDKRLNIVITGNNVVITKEWFKYLINDTNINYVTFDKQNNLIENKFMDINNGFNFIDNINCIIESEENTKIDHTLGNGNIQIIYKPIFFKVQDLQNLRIRRGVTQKIGINLGEYMNTIDLFILNIEGNNIKESSRNDIYVIFEINSSILELSSGIYNILDQNFEYISSGNYILY